MAATCQFLFVFLLALLLTGCPTMKGLDPNFTAGLTDNGVAVSADVGSASLSTTGLGVEVETEEFTLGFSVTACIGPDGGAAGFFERYLGSFGTVVNNFLVCPRAPPEAPST